MTCSRTAGMLTMLTLAAVAFAAAVLSITVAAVILIVASACGAAALLAAAVLPASWRHRSDTPATPSLRRTIDAVTPPGSSDDGVMRVPACGTAEVLGATQSVRARYLWFSQLPPRINIQCPRCGSPIAIVAYERTRTQSCFCPGCQHLWQTLLTRTAAQSPPR